MIIWKFRKIRKARIGKFKNLVKVLAGRRPLRRGIVSRPVIRSPKKPHSGKRATVKFYIPRYRNTVKNYAYVAQKDGRRKLKKYDVVFVRGGHRRDIPAMKYIAVYGVRTKWGKTSSSLRGLTGFIKNARSKYGAKGREF
jgi:ribosomal protein S12